MIFRFPYFLCHLQETEFPSRFDVNSALIKIIMLTDLLHKVLSASECYVYPRKTHNILFLVILFLRNTSNKLTANISRQEELKLNVMLSVLNIERKASYVGSILFPFPSSLFLSLTQWRKSITFAYF